MVVFTIYSTLALLMCTSFWRVGRALAADAAQSTPDAHDSMLTKRAPSLNTAGSDIEVKLRRRSR